MIIRYYVECTTCHKPYTLRISVGHGSWQEHSFHCLQCEEMIRVGMEVDYQNVETHIKCIENCIEGHLEGAIVNLTSELPIDEKLMHEDSISPFIMNPVVWSLIESLEEKSPEQLEEIAKLQPKFRDPLDEWKLLKKAWSLYNNGKEALLVDVMKDRFKSKDDIQSNKFLKWLFEFCQVFCGKSGLEKFNTVSDFVGKVRQNNSPRYNEYSTYFYENIGTNNFPHYLDIFSDYFADYSEFNQVALYSSLGVEIPDDFRVTSARFKKIKMFYGNAYELFTSNVVLLALLNNVYKGRSFDQFAEMDLKKYLSIDKANRCNPFRDTTELTALCKPLDSTLRNASHHGAIKYDHRTYTISYRSGGTGAERKMTYARYLGKCIDIMISICVLLMMEIVYLYGNHTE